MTDRPPPLLPEDVDLTDFGYMPLDVRRLRDSWLASHVTGDEFRAAVLLWSAAWHQVPASSLPCDDIELAQLAGYGRVTKAWHKDKKGALHGWLACSDGRLWHGVVATKAAEAWNQKRDHAWSRECDRIRKENKKRGNSADEALAFPDRPPRISVHRVAGIPLEIISGSAGIPAENALKGTEGTEGKRKKEKQAAFSDLIPLPPAPLKPANGRDHAHAPPTAENGFNGWEDGREVVGGHFWDAVWPQIVEAARIDLKTWLGNEIPARKWLRERFDPEIIVSIIRKVAERPGYPIGCQLAYFDQPIRNSRGKSDR